jgi:hypothetical protein
MNSRQLLISLVFLGIHSAWSQTAILKGKVLDAADGRAIPGTHITVKSGKNQWVGISLGDGHYEITGLKRGEHVEAYYSRNGYKPNPMPSIVVLSGDKNLQDVQLIRDTPDAKYWLLLSGRIKQSVESVTTDQATQLGLYEQTWSDLRAFGFSPDVRAQAARQLVATIPQTAQSHSILSFASVDERNFRDAETNIRAAVHGKATLSNASSIPADVAAEIAVDELKRNPVDSSLQEKFSKNFEATWGSPAGHQFREQLDFGCLITDEGSATACLASNKVQPVGKGELLVKAPKEYRKPKTNQ